MINIFQWFRSLWHKDVAAKSLETAKTLISGLSTDQFYLVVDEVTRVGNEPISGLEKAKKVKDIITDPKIVSAYRLPPWVNQGIDLASTVVQLAWVVAKVLKRIK
jgi:hypothetical protein